MAEDNLDGVKDKPLSIRRYKKVSDYKGITKGVRIFSMVLALAIIVTGIAWGIYRIVIYNWVDPEMRQWCSFAMVLLALLPFAIERLFKFNFSNFLLCIYMIFVLFAGLLGSGIGWYRIFRPFHYDTIMHGIFGYFACIVALYIACRFKEYKCTSPIFIGLFIFALSMACGAMWEIFEFSCDRLLGASAQGDKVLSGYAIVYDTMKDLLANFFGAILFTVQFVLAKSLNKNLLIGSMEKDFSGENG